MSGYFKQMRHGKNDARRQLDERLAREEMGDAAYEESRSWHDDRTFRIVGFVFIAVFALALLGVVWMES